MNIDYSQFYRGTTNIPSYGNGIYKKDTLVKYEFNTTDEHGNKVMDKMSREETLQAMKDIGSQYGDAVIVEFSGDGMAALVENKKGVVDANISQDQQKATDARNVEFQKEITQVDNTLELPAYSGMYGADKAVASAVENCSKEESINGRRLRKAVGGICGKNIKDQKLDATFSDIKTENKAAFLKSLKAFQNNNPNFLSSIINRELASKFWGI